MGLPARGLVLPVAHGIGEHARVPADDGALREGLRPLYDVAAGFHLPDDGSHHGRVAHAPLYGLGGFQVSLAFIKPSLAWVIGLKESKGKGVPAEHVLASHVDLLHIEDSDLAQLRPWEGVASPQLSMFVVAPAVEISKFIDNMEELRPN